MRRSSPQGSGPRRECGNSGATKANGEVMGTVWEMVSALASALTDARDQLVNLMHNSTMPRMTGGCTRHPTPARPSSPYPGAGPWVRNLHRAHAHGHVAFGCSSEYRLHPTPLRVRQPPPILFRPSTRPKVSASQAVRRSPRRCTHPLHKMHVSPSRSPSLWPPHVGAGRSRPGSRRSSSPQRDRRNRPGSPASCTRSSASNRNTIMSPDQERHCIGSQYASLLRQETYQVQERRLAENSGRGRRPPWSRC